MARVLVGLGSNVGDREAALAGARDSLGALLDTRIAGVSSLFETEPWGRRDQPASLNMAVLLETALPPRALLDMCRAIESRLGRVPGERWGPRVIDLDLILWDALVMNEETLTLPHPAFRERRFVLVPAAEIAAGTRDPVTRLTLGELLARCGDQSLVTPWPGGVQAGRPPPGADR